MEEKKVYFECPNCGSDNLVKTDYGNARPLKMFTDITCSDCDFTWREIYHFQKNEEVTPIDSM